MIIVDWDEFIGAPPPVRPMAATIGVFDGLHLGHQALIHRVVAHSEIATTAAFTFKVNPKKILRPEAFSGDLVALDQKLEILEALGLDLTVLIDFSGDFSRMPGRNFMILVEEHGDLSFIAVGSDFHCGRGQDTDARILDSFYRARGIGVEVLEPVSIGGSPVSSSRIREAVRAGKIPEANELLGRPYELELGEYAGSDGRYELYRPPEGIVLPPDGSYVVSVADGKPGPTLLIEGKVFKVRDTANGASVRRVSLIMLD